ncbi:MAG: 4-alpha-glucanotransferase [Prevotella sp.]|nr:4-alpha-glucanotransferase [Prevotella sp.]
MKLKFSIHYRTEWGQQVVLALSYHHTDGTTRTSRLPMTTQDGELWAAETAAVESRRSPIRAFTYVYLIEDADGHELRREWDMVPRTYELDATKTYTLDDQWHDIPLPYHLYSSAYAVTTGLMRDPETDRQPYGQAFFRKTLLFRVSAPQLSAGQQLAILGSHPVLGAWSEARYQLMEHIGQCEWMLSINADAVQLPLEYKYVVIDSQKRELVKWEEGNNRFVDGTIADGEVRVLTGDALRLSEKPWRAAGVSLPVFALRSETSCGVGDFGDLYSFVDWVSAVGMEVIQLLPLNDTTVTSQWGDSYPYNIVSAFALHPHYLDLRQLGTLKDKHYMTSFKRQQSELNALAYSDYEAVERVKSSYVAKYFEEQGAALVTRPDFLQWEEQNRFWLDELDAFYATHHPQPSALTHFVQYHLHLQLKRAADYARSKGIVLKGDLPIGVNRQSAETLAHPDYFNLDGQAGAPPDATSHQGQNWGFPTIHLSAPAVDRWMALRMKHMEQYFDAIRIDHVLGYFRIWEIPADQLFANMGHYEPALPLTPGEIGHFGLSFRRDFLTRPFINDRVIDRLFGIHAQYVRDTFLEKKAYGLYDLKAEVATQRRIYELFHERNDENSQWIRDGLYRLVANVLLLEDTHQPDMYHPRIQAWQEPVFEALSTEERDAYMRLYNNYFFQRHSMFWGKTGYDRLSSLLRHTHMLVCAEDLGMTADCVAPVLDSLRILTLEVQQTPKQTGVEFTHLDGNPVRSVATITTHDMAPLRLWWQENPALAQHFWTTMLQKQGRAPEQLPAHVAEEIVARHLYCPSMLCILSLQDWLAIDSSLRSNKLREERINDPRDPYNRWQWRMHLSIGDLLKADRFIQKLQTMVVRSRRSANG